jgi:hypothetical protein
MPIPIPLDYVIEKSRSTAYPEGRVLKELAGVTLSNKEARVLLPRIIDHKWYVSERLGRDIGLRVAAIDFIENIYEPPSGRNRTRKPFDGIRRLLTGKTVSGSVLTKIWNAVSVQLQTSNQWPS